MIRKLLSLSLLCLGLTAGANTLGGKLNGNTAWKLTADTLYIYGTGHTPNFTKLESRPWSARDVAARIGHIVIGEGITGLGDNLFSDNALAGGNQPRNGSNSSLAAMETNTTTAGFPRLKSITLPSSLRKIGYRAFKGAPITSIALPEGLEEIGAAAFSNSHLRSIILPEGIRKIGSEAFGGCPFLRAVDFNGAAIRLPIGAFFDCESLKIFLHTYNITSISESAFAGTALDKIDNDKLLKLFHRDGLDQYLAAELPPRNRFDGSDDEFLALKTEKTNEFYTSEATNAKALFELDDFRLMPYDPISGNLTILTTNHGELIIPTDQYTARTIANRWDAIRQSAEAAFVPANGRCRLQYVTFTLRGKKIVASCKK